MIIEFRFNSKSSGQNVPEAIRIAEKCGGFIEDRFYKIKFDDPQDDDLRKLYELVGNLKGSVILIGDEEPIPAKRFFNAINCPEKFLCKGICMHVRFGRSDILEFPDAYSESIENNVFSTYRRNILISLADFLEELGEDRFKFNKEAFLNYFKQETEMENKFCDKYNFNETQKAIEKLPDEIKIIPYEESPEYLDSLKEAELDLWSAIREIIDHSEISAKFSMPEIVECSKTISCLATTKVFTPLENSDVLISSFPESKLILFARLILGEDYDQIDELEEELMSYIITREKDFYCASNPVSKLYFRLFQEDDESLKDKFETLKKLK